MFYDLEDPVDFARKVKLLLKKDGIWVFEMSYLPLMLLQDSFDTICHEHLEYYSLAVLEAIMKKADLRIFRASINDINGGSIRCYACHASNSAYGTPNDRNFLTRLRIAEFQMELDTSEPYAAFERRIGGLKWDLSKLLFDIRAKAQRIHIYGASTKGNVLLQWYGVNRLTVDCAATGTRKRLGRERWAPKSRSYRKPSPGRKSPTTISCCPGTSAKSSCSARRDDSGRHEDDLSPAADRGRVGRQLCRRARQRRRRERPPG